MRRLEVYNINELDNETCMQINTLIQDRFKDRWGVERTDVTNESILNRINAIAFDKSEIVGVLGLEQSGEFVNGCSIKTVNGIYLLANLANKIYDIYSQKIHLYFAFFPKIDLAIPLSCYMATKGYLSIDEEKITKRYLNNEITFKRLNLFTTSKISKQEFIKQLQK